MKYALASSYIFIIELPITIASTIIIATAVVLKRQPSPRQLCFTNSCLSGAFGNASANIASDHLCCCFAIVIVSSVSTGTTSEWKASTYPYSYLLNSLKWRFAKRVFHWRSIQFGRDHFGFQVTKRNHCALQLYSIFVHLHDMHVGMECAVVLSRWSQKQLIVKYSIVFSCVATGRTWSCVYHSLSGFYYSTGWYVLRRAGCKHIFYMCAEVKAAGCRELFTHDIIYLPSVQVRVLSRSITTQIYLSITFVSFTVRNEEVIFGVFVIPKMSAQ